MTKQDRLIKYKAKIMIILLIIFDAVMANLAYGLALFVRFEGHIADIGRAYLDTWFRFIPIFAVCVVLVFALFKLYRSIWKFVSYSEMVRSFGACVILAIVNVVGTMVILHLSGTDATRMPLSYYCMGFMLMFFFLAGIRVSYRAFRLLRNHLFRKDKDLERVLLVGGGEAGRQVIRELRLQDPPKSRVVCIADDAVALQGKILDDVHVLGTIDDVPELVKAHNIDRVIIAIPGASKSRRREIITCCKGAECPIGVLPGISDRIRGNIDINDIRNVEVEDLLGRDTVRIDDSQVGELLRGKTILVTGGGGSIGSEIVRQIAGYYPARLVVFDIYENNAYEIQQEMKRKHPELNLSAVIGSVRDEDKVTDIINRVKPDVVFHAAAHKHVPLMEDAPCEAVKNNVKGTYNCAKAAAEAGVRRFLLISTDKAVNPTNVMGASKRLCEMIIEAMNEKYPDTEFVAVRFGNVLGSNGSVVPLFKKQIEQGGPVTVTHPEITRFFMTIPEAVSLVLQAGTYAKGGEIFVLDMGEPVKIDELARNLIELAGFVPDADIKIEYTGLRPGEKLYEEILMDEEGLQKTANELIFIGTQTEQGEDFFDRLGALIEAAEKNEDGMIEKVAEMVPTYVPKRDN